MRSAAPVAPGSKTDAFQVSGLRTVGELPYRPTSSFLRRQTTPSKGTLTQDETETPPHLSPEDVLSRPLVDVPDAVRGDLRERGGGGGGGERPQRSPGDDLRPRREGGPDFGLVPPGRVRSADARGVARPGRPDSRPVAREAQSGRLIATSSRRHPPRSAWTSLGPA